MDSALKNKWADPITLIDVDFWMQAAAGTDKQSSRADK
jgi:hypothetical protein